MNSDLPMPADIEGLSWLPGTRPDEAENYVDSEEVGLPQLGMLAGKPVMRDSLRQ